MYVITYNLKYVMYYFTFEPILKHFQTLDFIIIN